MLFIKWFLRAGIACKQKRFREGETWMGLWTKASEAYIRVVLYTPGWNLLVAIALTSTSNHSTASQNKRVTCAVIFTEFSPGSARNPQTPLS